MVCVVFLVLLEAVLVGVETPGNATGRFCVQVFLLVLRWERQKVPPCYRAQEWTCMIEDPLQGFCHRRMETMIQRQAHLRVLDQAVRGLGV